MKLLVVGGGGYIGSHMVKRLFRDGHDVTTLDDFSSGYRDSVLGGRIIKGSISDVGLLETVFSSCQFDAVLHFASLIQVGESVAHPAKYYRNNLANTLNLLDAMVRHKVRIFVFSSTAAVYGEPKYVPIDEQHPVMPVNPYGASKAMVEQVLRDYDRAYGLKSVCLRYFNACGADPEGGLGERHMPETHLIPLAIRAALDRRNPLTIFGRDYDTPDGTCIRDYVHISDLCEAHVLALQFLMEDSDSSVFNLGNGEGFSVAEVISAVERVTARSVPILEGAKRAGDPARLVANASRAKAVLGWQPRYVDLDLILSHVWAWEKNHKF